MTNELIEKLKRLASLKPLDFGRTESVKNTFLFGEIKGYVMLAREILTELKIDWREEMKISKVLREARKFLVEDKCLFVCSAVNQTSASEKDKFQTKRHIKNLIHPHASVLWWLMHDSGIDFTLENDPRYISLKEYRIRWIDHMISELEKQGK